MSTLKTLLTNGGEKPWYLSKTIIAAFAAFVVAIMTGAGVVDVETGATIEAAIVALALALLRKQQMTE